jgi:poly-gamma-glutamate capsule biosynthesis protein CapA/YwtB (metallophosphatase superfamily)
VRALALLLRAGAVVALLAVAFSLLDGDDPVQGTAASSAEVASGPAEAGAPRPKAPPPPRRVTIVAVGDIVMGSAPQLPPKAGSGFFGEVDSELAGDVVLGNLEGVLTTETGSACDAGETGCGAYRLPPLYAGWLKQAGFTTLNLANDHAFDFGRDGLRETVRTLDRAALLHTGRPGEVAYQRVGELTVAVVGFAPYRWSQSLTDIAAAARLVHEADESADIVIATFHGGAEGAGEQRVVPGPEVVAGKDLGDPVTFAHAVVDAGADLVVGHGPRVLRGMEWYEGRLIAYSLGSFAGYAVRPLGGPLSVGAILRLTLRDDGRFESGILVPTRLAGRGVPELDPDEQAHAAVRELSRLDFGARGASIAPTGDLGT